MASITPFSPSRDLTVVTFGHTYTGTESDVTFGIRPGNLEVATANHVVRVPEGVDLRAETELGVLFDVLPGGVVYDSDALDDHIAGVLVVNDLTVDAYQGKPVINGEAGKRVLFDPKTKSVAAVASPHITKMRGRELGGLQLATWVKTDGDTRVQQFFPVSELRTSIHAQVMLLAQHAPALVGQRVLILTGNPPYISGVPEYLHDGDEVSSELGVFQNHKLQPIVTAQFSVSVGAERNPTDATSRSTPTAGH